MTVAALSEFDNRTVHAVDELMHMAKARHSSPPGNPVFRLLVELARPVCEEVTRRHPDRKHEQFTLPPQYGLSQAPTDVPAWAYARRGNFLSVSQVIAAAWSFIAACPHKDPDDGTCHHVGNPTPECHEGACPYAN